MDGSYAVDLVTSITAFLGLVKSLGDVAVSTPSVDLNEKMTAIREQAIELRELVIHLKDENTELKRKLAEKHSNESETLDFHTWAYFRQEDQHLEEPFCPICYTNDGKRSRLVAQPSPMNRIRSHRCCVCQAYQSKPK